MRRSTIGTLSGLYVAILGLPSFSAAQIPDSIQSDTLDGLPQSFRMTEIRVLARQRLTATGGVGAVEMRLDSLGAVPIPTLEQALREMPLVRIRVNSRGEAQPSLRGATDRQIAVLVDGVPLTLGWDHRTDLSIIPLTAGPLRDPSARAFVGPPRAERPRRRRGGGCGAGKPANGAARSCDLQRGG